MKTRPWLFFLGLLCGVLLSGSAAGTQSTPPAVGSQLPEFELTAPELKAHQHYLGIQGKQTFGVPQIKAEVVIVELFSMYCPHCQREAPMINDLYHKIENNAELQDRFKLIGIGVGNSDFEVKHFQKTYDVPFPLFSDADFAIHQKLGEVRTPYFIAIAIDNDGGHKVIFSKLGGIKDLDQFLDELKVSAGL